jgi:hypothetical protein
MFANAGLILVGLALTVYQVRGYFGS